MAGIHPCPRHHLSRLHVRSYRRRAALARRGDAGRQGVEILDRNGKPIQSFDDQPGSGRVVPLGEISPSLVNATLATEDAEFWNNPGVNPKGLARAVYENLAFWETGGLFKGSGGSSITQQLAKNLYVKPEDRAKRTPTRKLKETMVAFELTAATPRPRSSSGT